MMRTHMILGAAAVAILSSGSVLAQPASSTIGGCTLLVDATTSTILKEEGQCRHRITPASTFKIAISLMGYDAGFLINDHEPALPFRDGYPDYIPSWRATTDPTSWISNSVVWYSQQVTQSLGEARFRTYAAAFHYGNEDVSGDPGKRNGLTRAWLSSSLAISPLEQAAFLGRLVRHELPVSAKAYEMTSRITMISVLANGWEVHGKTGAGAPHRPDGSSDWDHGYGWFVGWATKGERTIVFARQIQDATQQPVSPGLRIRAAFMQDLPAVLDAL